VIVCSGETFKTLGLSRYGL